MAFLRQYAFDGVDFDWVRNVQAGLCDWVVIVALPDNNCLTVE